MRMIKCMCFFSRKADCQPLMNSRSPKRHFIFSAPNVLVKRSIKSMRSTIFEFPRQEKVIQKIGKAHPRCTMPSAKGLIFSFPDFQSVRSMDKSCFSLQIGRNRTTSQAISSMEKSDFAKKRCKRLYFESFLALPGIATAIQVRLTVRTLSSATMKQDNKSALALFHPSLELKIWASLAIWFMKFTSFKVKIS